MTLANLRGDICLAYLDDILVFSGSTVEDHLQKLTLIFCRLRETNIKLANAANVGF